MKRRVIPFVFLCVAALTSCTSGGATNSTTSTSTTTTLNPASLREAKKAALLAELFFANQVGDYEKPHKFFASIEEIQPILRKYGIFGNVKATYAGFDAIVGAQYQRELCDDIFLEDVVLTGNPTRTVGRFFSWVQQPGTDGAPPEAMWAHGGMNIFEVSDDDPVNLLADDFALRGGSCKPTTYRYGLLDSDNWQERFKKEVTEQWATEQQLLRVGVEIRTDMAVSWDSIRVFKIVSYAEMGLLAVIELNIIRNGAKNAPSIVEMAKTFAPAVAELEIAMESKLNEYLANL
ncbi:MAG: hypothetical protein EBS61_06275 [Betaproteobacteria bacterium]|nr:hypothetical protein [Betaproteobacteria bacterium]